MHAAALERGRFLLQAGKRSAARRYLRRAWATEKDQQRRGSALYYLAHTWQDLTRRVRAYTRFIRHFPRHTLRSRASLELSALYQLQGKLDQARHALLPIAGSDGEGRTARFQLARIALRRKRAQAALRQLAALGKARNEGEGAHMLFLQGLAQRVLGRHKRASRHLLWILERYPRSEQVPAALYQLGDIAYQQDQFRLAWDYLRKLQTRYPNAFETYLARGRLLVLRRRFRKQHKQRVYEIQLAVYTSRAPALRYVRKLKKMGYKPFIHERERAGKKTYYSVRLGFYRTRSEANRVLLRLKQRSLEGFIRTRMIAEAADGRG